ncbi:MAG: TolC family protein [Gemmatimonadaceae bacterium]
MKSWFIRSALTAIIVPALAAAQQGADNPRPISVDDAVRLAVQNSPITVAARNSELSGEAAVKYAKFQFLPSLALNYSASNQGGTQFIQGVPVPLSGLPWSYSRSISSNITIFDGGAHWYNYKAAGATLDADVANNVTQRYAVALSVKTQYFAVLAAREQEAAARRQLEEAQQSLQVAAAKMIAGAATRADSLTAALAVGTAQLAIITAQNALLNGNAALTRLIASPVMVTAIAADTADIGHIDIDEGALTKMALEGPAIRSATAAYQASTAAHKAATTPYMPSITASGSYGQNPKGTQGYEGGGGPTTTSTSLRFTASYTLFNNYSREQTLILARLSENNAQANLRDAKFAAQQNLTQFLVNYQTAQQTIALQLLQIQSATENLRVQTQRYNIGTALQVDVTTAQAALDQARFNLISARLSARTAKANIEALIGHDIQ